MLYQDPKAVFAANLSRLLAQRGISQAELVRALGFRQATVSDWMKGKKYPRVEKLQLLSGYLGVPKAALTEPPREGAGPAGPAGSVAWLREGLLARGAITTPDELDDRQLKAILANMETLARAYRR